MATAEPRVRVFVAANCHLCDIAVELIEEVCAETRERFELVPIDGDPDLEARYRKRIPVVEVDGEDAFTFFVQPDALRRRLATVR